MFSYCFSMVFHSILKPSYTHHQIPILRNQRLIIAIKNNRELFLPHLYKQSILSEPCHKGVSLTCPLPPVSLDNDNEKQKIRLSDDQVWQVIIKLTGVTNASAFQQLDDKRKRDTLKELKNCGASQRQLERLTGIGRGFIQRL